ncbi:MAG: hypothetical protein PVH87_01385 [Desulfobacteraceae bacterium]|jgi:hypothetical protein
MRLKSIPWRPFTLICALAPLLLGACAFGPSHFRRSYNVSEKFENYELMPGYDYYLCGLPYGPEAIVAIKKGYRLNSPHWQAVEMDEKKLRRMVDEILNNPGSEYNTDPNGAYIFDDRGKHIGVWYSVWMLPLLTFSSDTEFAISRPMTVFPHTNRDPEDWGIVRILR